MPSPCPATRRSDQKIDYAELLAAVYRLVGPRVHAAQRLAGSLPALSSQAFLDAPPEVQLAALLVLAEAYILGAEMADEVFNADYLDGRYHRPNLVAGVAELDRRRYPPTGDRDLWVRDGPAARAQPGPMAWGVA